MKTELHTYSKNYSINNKTVLLTHLVKFVHRYICHVLLVDGIGDDDADYCGDYYGNDDENDIHDDEDRMRLRILKRTLMVMMMMMMTRSLSRTMVMMMMMTTTMILYWYFPRPA